MNDTALQSADYMTAIDWIDAHPWFIAIGAEIAGGNPCGEPGDDWDEFQDIETEIMKRGTLAHSQIRWAWLGEECANLLRHRTKDFRLLAILLQALPHCTDRPQLPLAISLVARFLSRWSSGAYPGGRGRIAQAQRIVEALETLSGRAAEDHQEARLLEISKSGIDVCSGILAELAPDLGIRLAVLPKRLDALEAGANAHETDGSLSAEPGHGGHQNGSPLLAPQRSMDVQAPRPEMLQLDASNERSLKQSLSLVADFLLGLDVTNPLSYRLRRYATWYGISATPPIKSGTRTVLQPVSENIAEGYRSAAERGLPGLEIVQKLERSCHLQPFWLDGQLLAYRLAQSCGRGEVAVAIRAEAQLFRSSVSGLDSLSFSDGTAIVSADVMEWLGSIDQSAGFLSRAGSVNDSANAGDGFHAADRDMQVIVNAARLKADNGDTTTAMKLLDEARTGKQTPRVSALWELVMLECLSDWGMKSHAGLQASRLQNAILHQTVEEWEPELIKRIGRLTGNASRKT